MNLDHLDIENDKMKESFEKIDNNFKVIEEEVDGATGTFKTVEGKVITVKDGLIVEIKDRWS